MIKALTHPLHRVCAPATTARRAAFNIPPYILATSMKRSASGTSKMSKPVKQQHEGQQPNKDEHGMEEWKKRAPYRVHDDNDNFEHIYEASCHCGAVEYELNREVPLDSKLCHCTTCQTQHAAPFQWAAIFHKEDINFKHGHHDLEWYDPTTKSKEHQLPCKVRCKHCYSPIMDEGRNMILLFPSLIKFKSEKEKQKFRPSMHMVLIARVSN